MTLVSALRGPTPMLTPTEFRALSNPGDGDEVLVLADGSDSSIWRLRYRAASTNADKWEPIGSPTPLYSKISTAQALTVGAGGAGVWNDVATLGPDIVMPLSGLMRVEFGAGIDGPAPAGSGGQVGVKIVSGADPALNERIQNFEDNYGNFHGVFRIAVTAGQTLRMKYALGVNSATGNFENRHLTVYPIRVSTT